MADEIINIATLTIDKTEANKSIVDTKAAIFELQKANSELRKDINKNGDATGEQTKKFVENEQALKKLQAQYRTQSAAIEDLTLAELKENKALTESVKSLEQATAQNKELKKIRDQLNVTTEDGAQALALLNAQINANDNFLRENGTEQEKFRANVGNYPTLVNNVGSAFGGATQQIIGFVQGGKDAISSLTELGTQATASIQKMIGFENATNRAANATETLTNISNAGADASDALASGAETVGAASETASGGIMTLVKAAWAFVANPIGAVITALVVVVVILYNVFRTFQPLLDKIEQGFAAISAVVNVLKNTILAVLTGTKSLSEAFSGLGGEMSKAAAEAAALTKAQQDLEDAQKSQEVTTARNRAEINKLNVALKNRTLTEQERLKISKQIVDAEKRDYEQRKALVDQEVKNARLAIAIKAQFSEEERKLLKETGDATKDLAESRGGIYDEEYDALNKARLKAIALEDENTTNLEKVYNRRDKLQDDAEAKAQARRDKALAARQKALSATIKNLETEIAIERAKNAQLNQSDEQRLDFLNTITKRELELIEFKKTQGLLTEKEAQLASLNLAKVQSSETLALTERVLSAEIEAQKKKFEAKKKLSEQDKLDELSNAAFLLSIQEKSVAESKLLESEKALALIEIRKGYNENVDIIEKNYEESRKQAALIARQEAQTLADVAFETRILTLQDQGLIESEIQKATLDIQLEQKKLALDTELADEKRTAEEVRVLKELEDKKYATAIKKIDKEVQATKRAGQISMVKDALAAATAIFGDNKALAVASALINTYEGISAGVALGYPAAIPAVAAAAATGFAAVKNILQTDKGGGGGSSSATAGSISTPAAVFDNPARSQTVATVDAAPSLEPEVVQVPVLILADVNEMNKQEAIKISSS